MYIYIHIYIKCFHKNDCFISLSGIFFYVNFFPENPNYNSLKCFFFFYSLKLGKEPSNLKIHILHTCTKYIYKILHKMIQLL